MAKPSDKRSALPTTEYFAPYFLVEVDGRQVRPERRSDVVQLKVSLNLQEVSSCELALNNWDEAKLDFRNDFELGQAIKVQMGYADFVTTVFFGQVTGLAPKFPDSGPPTTTVTCLDGMVKLQDRQPASQDPRSFRDKADWQIAKEIAERRGLGFVGTQSGPVHPIVWQKNQDDAAFLLERASRIDFDCFVVHDAEHQRDTLFFVQPTDGRADQAQVYTLEYQKNLTSFTPQINVSEQVSKLTVRGWNPKTKQAISAEATQADLPAGPRGGKSGPQVAAKAIGDKQVVVDAPVATEAEARALAISLLCRRAYRFVTGEGQMIGLPNLRPGHNLEITNVGARFSGTYYVTGCEHIIGEHGFTTTFKVRRYFTGAAT